MDVRSWACISFSRRSVEEIFTGLSELTKLIVTENGKVLVSLDCFILIITSDISSFEYQLYRILVWSHHCSSMQPILIALIWEKLCLVLVNSFASKVKPRQNFF